MKRPRQPLVLFLFLCSFAISGEAIAQDSPEPDEMGVNSGWPFFISTIGVAAGGISTVAGFGITTTMVATEKTKDEEEILQTYLNQNNLALQQDLFLGAGESIQDLAQLFGVTEEDFPLFAAQLFEHRQELAALLNQGPITEEETGHFAQVLRNSIPTARQES